MRKNSVEPSSWASDLLHPIPLAAVAILAINDHLLKGSGLLPSWMTGKLSDVAGLVFFPMLLVTLARGASRHMHRPEGDRRALVAIAVVATGAVFALLKLDAPFNAWVTRVWGVNVMDASDLLALPVLPLSAAFMLRGSPAHRAAPSPARRCADFAALLAAAVASIATSAPKPPETPLPPQAVAVAAPEVCATMALTTCERSATLTYVVLEAASRGQSACPVEVTAAREVSASGAETPADILPARMDPAGGATASAGISFLRPVAPDERSGTVTVRLDVRRGGRAETVSLTSTCKPR